MKEPQAWYLRNSTSLGHVVNLKRRVDTLGMKETTAERAGPEAVHLWDEQRETVRK